MESGPTTKDLREVYASVVTEYHEKALRLQMLTMSAITDAAAFRQAADEVAELARKLGDIRNALKLYLEANLSPSGNPP